MEPRLVGSDALMRRLLPAAALTLLACTAEMKVLGPFGTPPEVPTPPLAQAAFLLDVNVVFGRIRVTSPRAGLESPRSRDGGPALSLVGGDAVLLTTSSFSASTVGAFQPGKVRVSFDVALTNRLDGLDLVGPAAFPAPPPGTTGPLLFPFDVAIATTAGGASTGGAGNDVIIVLPSRGLVAPSPDWNGAPWNFFNDSTCAGADDCFPWEEYGTVGPGVTTTVQRVGFDIDPTVGQFTVRMLVAADLHDLAPPPMGTVQGSISSPSLGPLAGVMVTASPGGQATVTDAAGGFTLAGLPAGLVTLVLTALPPVCSAQPSYAVTVAAGTVTNLPLTLTCTSPALLGAVTGVIVDTTGAPLPSVLVRITPTGLSPEPAVATDAAGHYLAQSVDVSDGTGVVDLLNLPATCSDPGPVPYNGLVSGGTLVLDLVVACGP